MALPRRRAPRVEGREARRRLARRRRSSLLERRARAVADGPGRSTVDLRVRRFEPVQQVAARAELRGGGRARGRRRPRRRLGRGLDGPDPAAAGRAARRRGRLRRAAAGAGSEHQRRAVAPQPAGVLAPVGRARLQQRPEARRVVHHLEVADLVLDHVVQDGLGRQQQPPVERHRAVGRARRPAGALAADRQPAVARAGAGGGGVQARADLRPGAAAVPALDRLASRRPAGPAARRRGGGPARGPAPGPRRSVAPR